MANRRKSQEDTDGDFRTIKAMAERLGLKGEDASRYVHKHMTKLGHKGTTRYVPGGDDDKDGDGDEDFF